MLLLDAIFAGLLLHYFGESAITILGLTAIIAFLRVSGRLSRFLDAFDMSIMEIELENEEEEN